MPSEERWLPEGAKRDAQSITRDWKPLGQVPIDGVIFLETRPVIAGYGHLTELFRREWLPDNGEIDQIFTSCLNPAAVSAWHAHSVTTDRLGVVSGALRVVLYDGREQSATYRRVNEFRIGAIRPGLLVVPPRVWHGIQNIGSVPAMVMNAVDRAYSYESPDHWRLPADSAAIPFTFPSL